MQDVTTFKWKIANLFQTCCVQEQVCSDAFSLNGHSSAKLSLFVDGSKGWATEEFLGIVLSKIDNDAQADVAVKFWLEKRDGTKFHENSVQKHEFTAVGQVCGFGLALQSITHATFYSIYIAEQSLIICCELKCLNPSVQSKPQRSVDEMQWKLYTEGQFSDFTLEAGGKQFKIHRNIFAGQSEVIKSIFLSKFNGETSMKAEIKNVSAQVMDAFVKWMYLGIIDDKDIAEKLFVLADRYAVEALKAECTILMCDNLTEENAARYLALALTYKNNVLEEKTLTFVKQLEPKKLSQVIQSKEWYEFLAKKHGACK